MSRVTWADPGSRFYETGVDRTVLYVNNVGIAWSGVQSISESPTGGEARPFYMDGIKYLNIAGKEEFEATIEALGSPAEFGPCDGRQAINNGLFAHQQPRKAFSLSYRTLIGNDTVGQNLGYKIHLVYNALAAPSDRSYSSTGDSSDPTTKSWALTTLPPSLTGMKPTAHFVIDSRSTPKMLLAAIEDILYGSDAADPRMPLVSELIAMFKSEGPLTRTNLMTNPSFRSTTTPTEVLRNFIKNPSYRATSNYVERLRNKCVNPNPATTSGYSTGTPTAVPAPWDASRGAIRGTGTGSSTFYLFSATADALIPSGTPVTVSGTIQVPAGKYYRVYVHVRTGNYYYSSATAPYVLSDGNPIRVSKTETLTSDAADVDLAILVYDTNTGGVLSAGVNCYMGDVMIQRSSILNSYFDGDTPASGDFTYAWTGTAKASSSYQRGAYVPNVLSSGNVAIMQSTAWVRPGRSYSARLASLYDSTGSGYGDLGTLISGVQILERGKTYTVSAWFYSPPSNPNTTAGFQFTVTGVTGLNKNAIVAPGGGEQFLSLTVTVPTDVNVTGAYLRIQNNDKRGLADIWISDLMFVEGETVVPFFDGTTPAADGLTYSWSGTADASAPIATGLQISTWSGSNGVRTQGPAIGLGYSMDIRKSYTSYGPIVPYSAVGDYYSAQVTLRAIPGESLSDASVKVQLHDGTQYVSTAAYVLLPADGSPVVVQTNASLPIANTGVRLYVYPTKGNPVRVTESIIEKVTGPDLPVSGPFFDGSSADVDKYFYYWDGTPDASTSHINTWN